MATKEDRLKALEQKQEKLKAQIQAIKSRAASKERQYDTRRKILIGGVMLKLVKEKKIPEEQLNQWLNDALTSDRDRALFGLPTKDIVDSIAA